MTANVERPVDHWFANYSADHRSGTNQQIHVVAVPAILWSVIAFLWCVPVMGTLFENGVWAALAMFAASMFYWRLSRPLAIGMYLAFVAMAWLTRWLQIAVGTENLFWTALAVFIAAWIAQFVGHRIEGKKPSFLTDLVYLLIGPLWVLAKLYRKLGIPY